MAVSGTAVIGRGAEFALSVAGSTYTKLGGGTNISANFSYERVPTTDMDSAGSTEIILGDRTMEITAGSNYEEDADGQVIAMDAFYAGTLLYFRLRPQTGSAKVEFKGRAYCIECPLDIPENSKMTQNFKFESSGAVTFDRDQTA